MSKSKPTKRDREVRIQAWLDPQNPSHKAALEIFSRFRQNNKPEAIMANAMIALKRDYPEMDDIELPKAEESKDELIQMTKGIRELLESMIRDGVFVAGSTQSTAIHGMVEQLTAVEESSAKNYRTVNFRDEV